MDTINHATKQPPQLSPIPIDPYYYKQLLLSQNSQSEQSETNINIIGSNNIPATLTKPKYSSSQLDNIQISALKTPIKLNSSSNRHLQNNSCLEPIFTKSQNKDTTVVNQSMISMNNESKNIYNFPQIGAQYSKSSMKPSQRQSASINYNIHNQQQSTTLNLKNIITTSSASGYDLNKLRKSSKSMLQKYEKIHKGISYLQPFSNHNSSYLNDSRNDKQIAQNNSLQDNLHNLKQQQKQDRYKSVQQSIQYEIPHLKSNDAKHTLDLGRDHEVFYSIDQTHEYDYVNASLKILPNMMSGGVFVDNPDKPLNFITKKKKQLKTQLKGLLNEQKLSQQFTTSQLAQQQELDRVQSQSFINFSNNMTSLKELLDNKNVDIRQSSSMMSHKHSELDSNPLINKQLLHELSQMPSQVQLGNGGGGGIGKIQLIPRREFIKIEEKLDELDMIIKEKMIPKEQNLNYDNHLTFIQQNFKSYQQIFEDFSQKLSNKHFKKEKELLSRLLNGFCTQFKDLQQLSSTQLKLTHSTIQELNSQIANLAQEFETFKQTQSIQAYFLKQLEDTTDPKEKREKFVQSIDDFLGSDTLKKVWDQGQDERETNMDKSKFSGVSVALKNIKDSMKGYKEFSKLLEYMGINEENEDPMLSGSVHQREHVVKQIETEINSQIKDVQKTTAKKILARFMKQTQTANAQCQAFSMEELTYDLQRQIDELKDRGDSLRFEKIQLQIKNDKLQEQVTQVTEQKRQIEKTLTQSCDLMQVEVQQIKLEKQRMQDDMDSLRQQLQDKEEYIKNLERKVEDKDYIQSRLNSLRNKYEEYDQVHNETVRNRMQRSGAGSLHFNDGMSDDGKSSRSNLNPNKSYKFQAKQLRSLDKAESKQSILSRNQYNNQELSYNQSSSRANLMIHRSQVNRNSQYSSESQVQTNRDHPDQIQLDQETPRERHKTVVRDTNKSSQKHLQEDTSRPISLGNSPRNNDMKVTISSNNNQVDGEDKLLKENKNSSQQRLKNQKDSSLQSKIALKNKQNLKANIIANNKDISHTTQSQSQFNKSRNQNINQKQSAGTHNSLTHIPQNKTQEKINQVENNQSKFKNRINLNNQNTKEENSHHHQSQQQNNNNNNNRFKNSNIKQQQLQQQIQDSERRLDNESSGTLEIEQNQYVIEDEAYDNQYGLDSGGNNNQQQLSKAKQQTMLIQQDGTRKSIKNSQQRFVQYEQDAYGRKLSIRDPNLLSKITLLKDELKNNSATKHRQNRNDSIPESQFDSSNTTTNRENVKGHQQSSSNPDPTNTKNKITTNKPDESFYKELDPKYNTNELLLNNYKSTKDLFLQNDGDNNAVISNKNINIVGNMMRDPQQFSTVQQFPKIRSQVSIISRKSNNIPMNQEEYQTFQNQFSHNKSSDMIHNVKTSLGGGQNHYSTIQNTASVTHYYTPQQKQQQPLPQPQRYRNVSTFAVQTENDLFMDQIIDVVKTQIISQLEQEKYKYTDKEYEILIKKAMELVTKIRSKIGSGGDVFFKAGQFIAQTASIQQLNQISQQASNNNHSQDSPTKSILGINPSASNILHRDISFNNKGSLSPDNNRGFRVEEHFKVRLQKRAGGAGNFQRYSEKKNLRDPTQVLYSTSIQKQQNHQFQQ